VILLGALVAVWGALVLGLAKTMHVRWKGMLAEMRRSGVADTIPLTRWFASEGGLRGMRVAGGVALAVGLAMVAAGALR
jgi:hypothetical protein